MSVLASFPATCKKVLRLFAGPYVGFHITFFAVPTTPQGWRLQWLPISPGWSPGHSAPGLRHPYDHATHGPDGRVEHASHHRQARSNDLGQTLSVSSLWRRRLSR